ncbi:MAG: right-handed parallel beta-helix repeat-containing protein [Candidatus Thermoplasmatota archaeon]|nr:right-handed parallel beta-helix repeat-containing protein [Candidatus Thermoplasmatota archaeon]MBU1941072.1 right-handed parallel beta-helix repeat-containing protein [Candidatus Thermoplasmatota archaeon]
MKKNHIILIIVILLLSSQTIPALPSTLNYDPSTTPKSLTLYVGGSGPGNYSTIQQAVDNTTTGDTVFVYSGYYFENITINTSIHLFGENQKTTVIDAMEHGPVVTILADNVTLYNFSIQNACDPIVGYAPGIKIVHCHDTIIKHNILGPKNSEGLYMYQSDNNTIYRNTFYYNRDALLLSGSNNNQIIENHLGFSDIAGLNIFDSHGNQIIRNNFLFNMINTRVNGNTFELINNSWDGNYWSLPLYQTKRIPVFIFPLKLAFQYDNNPALHPNGKLEILKDVANNTIIRLKGRVTELINTSSWNEGLKIGRVPSIDIIVNTTFGEHIKMFTAHSFEFTWGRIPGYTEIIIENATGIFNRPQINLLKNLPQRIYILCFAEKLTITYYFYWFSWD